VGQESDASDWFCTFRESEREGVPALTGAPGMRGQKIAAEAVANVGNDVASRIQPVSMDMRREWGRIAESHRGGATDFSIAGINSCVFDHDGRTSGYDFDGLSGAAWFGEGRDGPEKRKKDGEGWNYLHDDATR